MAFQANGWMWGKNAVVDWRAAIERQIHTDRDKKPDWKRADLKPKGDNNAEAMLAAIKV